MTDKDCLDKIQDIVDDYMFDEDSDGIEFMDRIVRIMLERDKPYNGVIDAIKENNKIADQRPNIDFSGTKYDI